MKIIEKTTEFELTEDTAVAIGKFDGFHMGHQKLLHMVTEQKAKGLAAAVFTFVPSPAAFFSKEAQQELTTIQEKRNIFEEAGVDYLIEYPFYQEIADMEPETYIRKVLVEQLHAKCIVAGEDVSFGKKGMGNYRLLEQKSAEYGYQVIVIDKVQYQGREISSTYVRDAVKQGEMELVTKLLGQPYHVGGMSESFQKTIYEPFAQEKAGARTVYGGTGLGMPTVNILPPPEKLLPPNGVYYSYVMMNGRIYLGITNIGTKPTVSGEAVMGVETFIYDFDQDVYGQDIQVYLLHYKRPEMRFHGIEALKKQMATDIAAGREYHGLSI